MMLPQLPQDKANHALYGAVIFNAVYPLTDLHVALAVVVGVAAGKEANDWMLNRRAIKAGKPVPHGVEFFDALATLAGGVLCCVPLLWH